MKHTILTMSHNDERRLPDWIKYHAKIGFDHFIIILDNLVDDSDKVLADMARSYSIDVVVKSPIGDYYTGLDLRERYRRVLIWREENRDRLTALGIPVFDPQTERQHLYFTERLEKLAAEEEVGWVAIIDVDEYIALPGYQSISKLTDAFKVPRIRLLNFNFGTDGVVDWRVPVRKQFTKRWNRQDIIAYGRGWDTRVKAIVRTDSTLPFVSVHPISHGASETAPFEEARLHHYRIPDQGIDELTYSVTDLTIAEMPWERTFISNLKHRFLKNRSI